MRYVKIADGKIPSELDIIGAAKYIVENLLPRGVGTEFYLVSFPKQTTHLMIAQKLDYSNGYASFILFGYGIKTMVYCTKSNGKWYQ